MIEPMRSLQVKECRLCGLREAEISAKLQVCGACIRESFPEALPFIRAAHHEVRSSLGLPLDPPREGYPCDLCVNMCRLQEGQRGFCGVRAGRDGAVESIVPGAIVSWYYDDLPTNCVADFVCPGGTGCGYPQFSRRPGPEYGYRNLAVFYGACNFSCLFCQNWRFRSMTRKREPVMTPEDLADKVDERTSCICYFGGDPTPQVQHAIRTSELALGGRTPPRVCFETNGSVARRYLREMARLSYESGGCIKFDLKAWDEGINYALCFATNKLTLRNFEWLVRYHEERGDRGVAFIVASTLLVPGYVEEEEVRMISSFIADLDPNIPYSLLAFSPRFMMRDMPLVSTRKAHRCLDIAQQSGLRRVRIGNAYLLA
ncbi:MAG: radical SAM protein [Thermoplasmata archaeon]